MAYQIAICDDNEADIWYLTEILTSWASSMRVSLKIDTFPSAEAFLFKYAEDASYDILLLDIEMAAMDGVALAKEIRRSNETVQIVFISGYSDYISEGYEVAALHYLMKPVHKEKFESVMERALAKVRKNEKILYRESFLYTESNENPDISVGWFTDYAAPREL